MTPMNRSSRSYDVAVIGCGLAGLSAARQCVAHGLRTVLLAHTPGSLPYTSGALDLLGVYPTETKRFRSNPWEALSELIDREPTHPYARVGLRGVRAAIHDLEEYLADSPLQYRHRPNENMAIITAAGTVKPSYMLPGSLASNSLAFESRRPTLIVAIEGFPNFSSEQVVDNLRDRWPGLRATRIDLGQLQDKPRRPMANQLADELEKPDFRARLAELLRPSLGQAKFLGFPAILGHDGVAEVCRDLSARLDVEVFEIPLISPSLPGQRLQQLMEHDLRAAGVTWLQGAPVTRLEKHPDGGLQLFRKGKVADTIYRADHVVLATGRFVGGGLEARRDAGVCETLLGVKIEATVSRDDWHMSTFLGGPGHLINRLGLSVDQSLRPLKPDGHPILPGLVAAGGLLEGHDWVREKSGAGISVATGYAAVHAIVSSRNKGGRGADK